MELRCPTRSTHTTSRQQLEDAFMQLTPGHLVYQLPPPGHEKVQLVAARAITVLVRSTPVEAVLAESNLHPISWRFQIISLLIADELVHLPPADVRRQTACRLRLKKRDWCNAEFLHHNQLCLSPQVLTPPPSCEQLSIPPWDKRPHIPIVINTSCQENV